jgi:Tetratricopeptide repeat
MSRRRGRRCWRRRRGRCGLPSSLGSQGVSAGRAVWSAAAGQLAAGVECPGGPEDIAGALPAGDGHVLITSRAQDWTEVAVPVEVDVLARAESVAILVNRVPGLDGDDAGRVAQSLGDLPLALAQAAGYMAGTGTPAGEYLELLAVRAAQVLDQGRSATYPRSLTAVTQLAFDRLRGEDPAAAALAAMCAFLAPELVPADWFPRAAARLSAPLAEAVADPLAWRQVLGRVRQQALARLDLHGLVMHRLTQAIVRGYLPPDQAAETRDKAAALLAANHPGDEELPSTWPGWARLLPHLLALDPEASTAALSGLTHDAIWYLIHHGDARSGYDLAHRLYRHRLGTLGLNNLKTLAAASTLATVLRALVRYDKAHELDEDALTWTRRVLGEDHPDTLASANNLAIDLRYLGEHQAARELDEDTLAGKRRVVGEDHPHTRRSARNLAADLRAWDETGDNP